MTKTFQLPDLKATERLAAALAPICKSGDVIALFGNLGAGKTTFSRYFVHSLGVEEEVPSPTFTLVQTYPLSGHDAEAIWHFDMYRINHPAEAYELDIEDAFDTGISLIEWPEKLGSLLPDSHLRIELIIGDTEGSRTARLEITPHWADRMAPVLDSLSDLIQ
ncbi:MAG: tRNA (adenosine(37)-N6)-threonylcarbamoyltransferase complex ATPase subunit type 1 TsaE [Alphaproteobacteria bacterium]|nr:MAG: tRNA (adenosine(37)-N6)-threonylcarbamoyltransferase complex ATPase subunit type 1 TsaE [Alphaproteobacteria bacterium]